jgi:hypothetical protein
MMVPDTLRTLAPIDNRPDWIPLFLAKKLQMAQPTRKLVNPIFERYSRTATLSCIVITLAQGSPLPSLVACEFRGRSVSGIP